MKNAELPQWSPYLAGALVGILIVLAVVMTGNYFGASTSFVRTAGMIEQASNPERTSGLAYYRWFKPVIDWQWMFVIGIFFGSLISALTSKTFRWQFIPNMWQKSFGSNLLQRGITAFIGGIVVMFGARLAGGCPSGHGLSGTLQLAISGYVTTLCFFIGGIFMAGIMYRRGKKK